MTELEEDPPLPSRKYPVAGIVDSVGAGGVSGWVADSRDPRVRVRVDIFLDGKYRGTASACVYRRDLEGSWTGDAFHGFHYPLPPDCLDGFDHVLEVFVNGTRQHLRRSPLDRVRWNLLARFRKPAIDARFGPNPVRPQAREIPRLPRKRSGSSFTPSGRSAEPGTLRGISVVIPSFNRGAMLEQTLLRSFACTEACEVEFVVVDDGSTDDTPERLARLANAHQQLRFLRVENGGQGRARNLGVELARHELVLFQGDDIRPAHSAFYRLHLQAHRRVPQVGVAVLGKVIWPDEPAFDVTFAMQHIQGRGQQQFGYYALLPYTFLDWRFFYTSNVSVKKSVLGDWPREGFHPHFREYGWEDAELAYRLYGSHPGGFGTLYVPGPVATHHHRYNTRQFMARQLATGRAARAFCRMHPHLRRKIGLERLERILTSPASQADLHTPRADILSAIDGLQAYACHLDDEGVLGRESWHDELLSGVFTASYLEGYIQANEYPLANYDAAYLYVLEQFQSALHTPLMFEQFGRKPPFAAIAPHTSPARASGLGSVPPV